MKRAVLLVALLACSKRSELDLVEVKQDDLVIGVEVTGELAAVDSLDVKPPPIPDMWDFKIANIANDGDDVKEGDPVISFDASELMKKLETMRNEADAAQKKLDKKRDDAALARRDDELKVAEAEAALRKASLKAVAPADLVASNDLKEHQLDEETAKLALEGAKYHAQQTRRSDEQEIEQLAGKAEWAKKKAALLQTAIGKMQVTAARSGTIVLPMGGNGEKHKVGDSVWRMEDVVQIVKLGKMVGTGKVDEVDIARVATGLGVTLRLDALPDSQLRGKVESIAKSVEAKSQTDPSKMARLKITLDATTLPLRPGMRFRGEIETEKVPHVVQVPAEAVFISADGPVAYRKSGGSIERVKLVLGKRSHSAIEVKSGLAPGDLVSRVDPSAIGGP